MTLDFDAPHTEPDPWGYERHWYEQRRRQLIAAMLPQHSLGQVLEIGCSTGLITQLLAPRADQLLAIDISPAAIALARQRLQGVANVRLEQGDITQQWPAQHFDHILLCDVGYYLHAAQLQDLAANIVRQLGNHPAAPQLAAPECVLLLAHWRHRFEQVVTPTEDVHRLLVQATGWQVQARYQDEDLLIDVLSRNGASVARQEGLV